MRGLVLGCLSAELRPCQVSGGHLSLLSYFLMLEDRLFKLLCVSAHPSPCTALLVWLQATSKCPHVVTVYVWFLLSSLPWPQTSTHNPPDPVHLLGMDSLLPPSQDVHCAVRQHTLSALLSECMWSLRGSMCLWLPPTPWPQASTWF